MFRSLPAVAGGRSLLLALVALISSSQAKPPLFTQHPLLNAYYRGEYRSLHPGESTPSVFVDRLVESQVRHFLETLAARMEQMQRQQLQVQLGRLRCLQASGSVPEQLCRQRLRESLKGLGALSDSIRKRVALVVGGLPGRKKNIRIPLGPAAGTGLFFDRGFQQISELSSRVLQQLGTFFFTARPVVRVQDLKESNMLESLKAVSWLTSQLRRRI